MLPSNRKWAIPWASGLISIFPPLPSVVLIVTVWPSIRKLPSAAVIDGEAPASTKFPWEFMAGLEAVGMGILTVAEEELPVGSRKRSLFWKKRSVGTPSNDIKADPLSSVVIFLGSDVQIGVPPAAVLKSLNVRVCDPI